jgi:hypothetical protein
MSTTEPFWPRRLRWRLLGAWRWPAFFVLTLVDGFVLDRWSPAGFDFNFPFGLIVASFGNIALIAVVDALARRAERNRAAARRAPPVAEVWAAPPPDPKLAGERTADRASVLALLAATVVLLLVGLLSQRVVVSETEATERNAAAVADYVRAHGSPEIRRNLDTANTFRIDPGYFRTCIARDDRFKAFCVFVDTDSDPPEVRPDPNPAPNGELFGPSR